MSWIKFDTATPDKPEVWQIASDLDIDPDAVVGKLMRVWVWFDAHTEDGSVGSSSEQLLDRVAGASGFTRAMQACGWLKIDSGTISIQSFDKHNGNTAKVRADTARRVAKHKSGKADNGKVTRNTLPRPLVAAVKLRDNATCVYCGRREGERAPNEVERDGYMCLDHVIPITKGGSDDIRNLVCACSVCNQFKSNRTPDECGLPWPVDSEGNKFGVTAPLANELPRKEKDKSNQEPHTTRASSSVQMRIDWKPDVDHWSLYAKRSGITDADLTNEILIEFTNHWHAEGSFKTEAEWVNKLVSQIKYRKTQGATHGKTNTGDGRRLSAVERTQLDNAQHRAIREGSTGFTIDG